MKHLCLWISCLLLLSACVERISLDESLDGEPLLVVDGEVTDAAGPYRVTLTYTSPTLEAFEGEKLTGAEVYLTDQEDNRTELTENEEAPGTYATDSATFRGEVGSTYQVHIITTSGRTYASIPETLLGVSPVKEVYFRVESRPKVDALGALRDEWGLQFYVATESDNRSSAYYRWQWSETFEFPTPISPPGPPTSAASICYLSTSPTRFIRLASTQGVRADRINQKLNFVTMSGRQLQVRYSLLVQQYSLTERAYTYWQNVQEQVENGGSIFDPPPSPLIGNVYNVNDDRETVLGYFRASAVAERRIFVLRSDVPPSPDGSKPSPSSACQESEPPEFCFDCSLVPGTTTVPPPFW